VRMVAVAPDPVFRADIDRKVVNLSTIDVAGKESANLMCSQCGTSGKIAVPKLPHRYYKVRCKCMYDFSIEFNRRKYTRKQTNLIATYSTACRFADYIIDIVDLSRGGLRFIRTDANILCISDVLAIAFCLDNTERDFIECTALIKDICGNHVCVEYLDMDGRMRSILGFYFFNP